MDRLALKKSTYSWRQQEGLVCIPMRGFVKGVRLRRAPSLPPLHLVPIRILSRRRDAGCLLRSSGGTDPSEDVAVNMSLCMAA